MSTSTVIAGSGSNGINGTETGYSFPRLMAWCIRRELWENRSIYLAPLAAAGLLIFAVLIPVVKLMTDPHQLELGANVQFNEFWLPYAIIAAPVLAISAFVALAYCLTALQNERRDRSLLFWKSLPVSDLITVLSKFAVPLVLVPLIAFVAAVFAQLTIFSITVAVFPHIAANAHLVWNGTPVTYQTVGAIWAEVPIGYISVGLFYGVLTMALWYAPVYAWLILVGGWARRMT
ncbi:MAG TPA: hypothetical protein VG501_11385, partial [Rhizomicrobium sp.]|nr:hypothetical protein [Rhizomicrobium sp.]